MAAFAATTTRAGTGDAAREHVKHHDFRLVQLVVEHLALPAKKAETLHPAERGGRVGRPVAGLDVSADVLAVGVLTSGKLTLS